MAAPDYIKRQFPRLNDILPLVGLRLERKPDYERAVTVWQLRDIAKRKTPRAVFDYTDGASGEEISLNRSRQVYRELEFHPHVLRDVAAVDPSVMVLGQRAALPFFFSPTGFTRMMHFHGEPAVARVAGEFGIPYTLSTLGTTSIADLAAAAPNTRRWFQLYLWRDKESRYELVEQAAQHGFEAIVLTVDTVVGGMRVRDVVNGLTVPPRLTTRTIRNMSRYPRWWANVLTTPPLTFSSLKSTGGTVAELMNNVFDPSITVADVRWLRANWPGKLVIKGVQNVDDAQMLLDEGVDALLLSNHGGRQLDRAIVPLELLPQVRQRVGARPEVLIDGGAMCGADVVAAVALGATGVMVGRAYLYGLMAGGEPGVRRAATILAQEVEQTMRLMGVTRLDELTPDMVRLRRGGEK